MSDLKYRGDFLTDAAYQAYKTAAQQPGSAPTELDFTVYEVHLMVRVLLSSGEQDALLLANKISTWFAERRVSS